MEFLEQMKQLAIEEAIKLKKLITLAEAQRLNHISFNPNWKKDCIYGQLTGDCDSPRAYELIHQCCPRVYKHKTIDDIFQWQLNGEPINIRYRSDFYQS